MPFNKIASELANRIDLPKTHPNLFSAAIKDGFQFDEYVLARQARAYATEKYALFNLKTHEVSLMALVPVMTSNTEKSYYMYTIDGVFSPKTIKDYDISKCSFRVVNQPFRISKKSFDEIVALFKNCSDGKSYVFIKGIKNKPARLDDTFIRRFLWALLNI